MPARILVVDDEPAICEALEDLLADEGYEVASAADGEAALAMAAANPPDLVISDLWMPRLDGAQLERMLRGRGFVMPVLILSAAVRMKPPPGVPYLPKPFEADALLACVAQLLGQQRFAPRSFAGC